MADCLICEAMLNLIKEYDSMLIRLDEIINYLERRWIHVTLYDCHPYTCNERHKELKDAENERWIISNRHKQAHIDLTEHYRVDHLKP